MRTRRRAAHLLAHRDGGHALLRDGEFDHPVDDAVETDLVRVVVLRVLRRLDPAADASLVVPERADGRRTGGEVLAVLLERLRGTGTPET
ncbi:hypothetical protein ACGF8B_26105 [Streptomyces sp. NPDC047917]|uniref:hypothetical protein n=1 Tax=Streptomyces sp. NPDC047917 TaxID=3365491 RepID=UPI00371E5E83